MSCKHQNAVVLSNQVYLYEDIVKTDTRGYGLEKKYVHLCVVIFSWSSGIMECTCMLLTFENRILLMR